MGFAMFLTVFTEDNATKFFACIRCRKLLQCLVHILLNIDLYIIVFDLAKGQEVHRQLYARSLIHILVLDFNFEIFVQYWHLPYANKIPASRARPIIASTVAVVFTPPLDAINWDL